MILIATCGLLNPNFIERAEFTLLGKKFNDLKYKHVFVVNGAGEDDLLELSTIFPETPIYFSRKRLGNFHSNLLGINVARDLNMPVYLTEEDYTWELDGFNISHLENYSSPVHILNKRWESGFISTNGYSDAGNIHPYLYQMDARGVPIKEFMQKMDKNTNANYNNEGYFIPKGYHSHKSEDECKSIFETLLAEYSGLHVPNDELILYLMGDNEIHYKFFTRGVFHEYERDMVGKSNFIEDDPNKFFKNYGHNSIENWRDVEYSLNQKINYELYY